MNIREIILDFTCTSGKYHVNIAFCPLTHLHVAIEPLLLGEIHNPLLNLAVGKKASGRIPIIGNIQILLEVHPS